MVHRPRLIKRTRPRRGGKRGGGSAFAPCTLPTGVGVSWKNRRQAAGEVDDPGSACVRAGGRWFGETSSNDPGSGEGRTAGACAGYKRSLRTMNPAVLSWMNPVRGRRRGENLGSEREREIYLEGKRRRLVGGSFWEKS